MDYYHSIGYWLYDRERQYGGWPSGENLPEQFAGLGFFELNHSFLPINGMDATMIHHMSDKYARLFNNSLNWRGLTVEEVIWAAGFDWNSAVNMWQPTAYCPAFPPEFEIKTPQTLLWSRCDSNTSAEVRTQHRHSINLFLSRSEFSPA